MSKFNSTAKGFTQKSYGDENRQRIAVQVNSPKLSAKDANAFALHPTSTLRRCSRRDSSGFTLIELLIAMGIFITVVTLVSSIYITTVSSQRRGFGKQNVLDSSRFALEAMARAVRQSTIVVSETDADTLSLVHAVRGDLIYELASGRITEEVEGGPAQNLTADDVVVQTLIFRGQGLGSNDSEQPRITIQMVVRSSTAKVSEQSSIRLQTTVTPRAVQIP
jgi:prepilin-type N-terminal cleavage/methylation domain-containing protein